MFDETFLTHVRNRDYYCSKPYDTIDYDMYDFTKYLVSHPLTLTDWVNHRKRVTLRDMHLRSGTPSFAKDIHKALTKTFHKNHITLHGFAGFTSDSESFTVHRDSMDVLFLNVIGSINWSIWESEDWKDYTIDAITDWSTGVVKFDKVFTPGDLIWIPRGTWHLIKPHCARVGFSFGVEGDIDPSTYI
jgi:ribosomal protein L16 Arg81 hydroxylase|tara:strand:- start:30 stop:593 length:564 start_codon:yes stop_codon:yes gene_type:complete